MADDPNQALWFDPQSIRDHFDGDDDRIAALVHQATDAQLASVAEWCLNNDILYSAFHHVLIDGVEAVMCS